MKYSNCRINLICLYKFISDKLQRSNRMKEYIRNLPKAELHLHIEGTLEPEMLFEFAHRNQVKIKYNSVEELRKAYQFQNLQEFLDIYYSGAAVLLTEQDFYELTYAYLKKAHEQGVIHSEIFFDPQTHTHRGISFDTVINGIYKATLDAKQQMGISCYIIASILRHLPAEDAISVLNESKKHKDKIIGIGLDSSENGHPPIKFKDIYLKAKEEGFKLVAHAGEEGPAEYVWQALNELEIDRIDHGNRSLEDPSLVDYIVEKQIALTVCPLSNLKLKVVKDMKKHPIKEMLDKGILATVNSDDPAYFGGYILENYLALVEEAGLSLDEINKLAENSLKARF